jgi:hypothetical protein
VEASLLSGSRRWPAELSHVVFQSRLVLADELLTPGLPLPASRDCTGKTGFEDGAARLHIASGSLVGGALKVKLQQIERGLR